MISIIDDDASVREALQRFLRALGYLAHAFASAEEFLRSSHLGDTACGIYIPYTGVGPNFVGPFGIVCNKSS